MRELSIDDSTRNAAALRARVRNQTGLIPDKINEVVTALVSLTHTMELKEASLAEALHLGKTLWRNQVADLRSVYVSMLPQARNDLIAWIVKRYEVCLPNVRLCCSDFVEMMDKTVGKGGFDAGLLEDMVCEMVPRCRQLALQHLLESARRLLPTGLQHNSKWCDKVLEGRKLLLAIERRPNSWAIGDVRMLLGEDQSSILSLSKLSTILIRKADPAAAQASACNPPSTLWLKRELFPYSITSEKPIRSITIFESGGLVVEYEKRRQACLMADALLGEAAPSI